MSLRVLVVDDSSFFRRVVAEIIDADPQLSVIATAMNGRDAIDKVKLLKPDVITMDIEMPVMDGIAATREIMRIQPTPIIMFSSLTYEGARATLDALDAGAIDFLPKRFDEVANDQAKIRRLLQNKIKIFGRQHQMKATPSHSSGSAGQASGSIAATLGRTTAVSADKSRALPTRTPSSLKNNISLGLGQKFNAPEPSPASRFVRGQYKLVAIGTSTGGPVALQRVLRDIPADFPLPILLVQHMPATFTPAFSKRLNDMCKIQVKEAEHGELIRPGYAYLAPGGKQMVCGVDHKIRIEPGDAKLNYKPSVDVTFASVEQAYGAQVLAIVLTGMGSDGREGATALKKKGATIWAQDEASCVVYGMPMAVAKAGIADAIVPLDDVAKRILEVTR